jgi:hypothetical protein
MNVMWICPQALQLISDFPATEIIALSGPLQHVLKKKINGSSNFAEVRKLGAINLRVL